MTKEKKNPILLYIIGGMIVGTLIWQGTFRLVHPKHQQALEAKIETCEDYYDRAKAFSISMPLLSDSVVFSHADGLYETIIDLNKSWVRYVATHDDYQRFTEEIQELTNELDALRVQYEFARTFRELRNTLPYPHQHEKKKEKKKTFV